MAKIQKSYRFEEELVNAVENIPVYIGSTETERVAIVLDRMLLENNTTHLPTWNEKIINEISTGIEDYKKEILSKGNRFFNNEVLLGFGTFLAYAYETGCSIKNSKIIEEVKKELANLDEITAFTIMKLYEQNRQNELICTSKYLYDDDKKFTIEVKSFNHTSFDARYGEGTFEKEIKATAPIFYENIGLNVLKELSIPPNRIDDFRVDINNSFKYNYNFSDKIKLSSEVAAKINDVNNEIFANSKKVSVNLSLKSIKTVATLKEFKNYIGYTIDEEAFLELWKENGYSLDIFDYSEKGLKESLILSKAIDDAKNMEEQALKLKIEAENSNKKQILQEEFDAELNNFEKSSKVSDRLKAIMNFNVDYYEMLLAEYIRTTLSGRLDVNDKYICIDVNDEVSFRDECDLDAKLISNFVLEKHLVIKDLLLDLNSTQKEFEKISNISLIMINENVNVIDGVIIDKDNYSYNEFKVIAEKADYATFFKFGNISVLICL